MKNTRVLIASDDEQTLRFLSDLLSEDSCIVGTVNHGKSLIAASAELHPHVVITDVDMPSMNALFVIRLLKALRRDLKVIVMSDHEMPEFAAQTIEDEVSVFLDKNKWPSLCGTIRTIVRDLLTVHSKQLEDRPLLKGHMELLDEWQGPSPPVRHSVQPRCR